MPGKSPMHRREISARARYKKRGRTPKCGMARYRSLFDAARDYQYIFFFSFYVSTRVKRDRIANMTRGRGVTLDDSNVSPSL